MGSIPPEKIGQEARLPRIEERNYTERSDLGGAIGQLAEVVHAAHDRCATLVVDGAVRSASYAQAVADRREAIRALRDTPVKDLAALETKRDILVELEVWVGREDPECCDFAMQLAYEAISLLEADQDNSGGRKNRSRNGTWGGPGRWLMGAATSVPTFILDRFSSG